ncbi:hypothetical protein TIFTF001_026055 [Ficus carica]|uniref:Uncharacterized protein n=1 Tax=Ficus carica TaxID=3494 RepID=A0AA88AKX9_FICCA|nr:hypothetical protein TIFTF001_026055 [Ficus carica]
MLVFAVPGFRDNRVESGFCGAWVSRRRGRRLVLRRLGFAMTSAEDGFSNTWVFGFSQWQAFVVGEMGKLR